MEVQVISMDGKIVYRTIYDFSATQQMILDISLQFESGIYVVRTQLESVQLVVK